MHFLLLQLPIPLCMACELGIHLGWGQPWEMRVNSQPDQVNWQMGWTAPPISSTHPLKIQVIPPPSLPSFWIGRSERCIHHWEGLEKSVHHVSMFSKNNTHWHHFTRSWCGANPSFIIPDREIKAARTMKQAIPLQVIICSPSEPVGNGVWLRRTVLDYYSY